MAEQTYWNGEPCEAERVIVRVADVINPNWWGAGLAGKERPAVLVRYGPDTTFLLDNDDGQGWHKVTTGFGGPEWGHRSLPDSSEIIGSDTLEACRCGEPFPTEPSSATGGSPKKGHGSGG